MQGLSNAGFAAPIDVLIKSALSDALRKANFSFDSYTAAFVDHYVKHVAPIHRTFTVSITGDVCRDVRNNSRKLSRYFALDTELRLHAVSVPSLIAALPEPWRSDVQTAVVDLIRPATAKAGPNVDCIAAAMLLVKEHGEALNAYLAIAKDGLQNDATADLMNARIQLLQSMQAAESAMKIIEDELVSRRDRTLLAAV